MLSDRRLLETQAPLNKGYMYQIEHVQVDIADSIDSPIVLHLDGLRIVQQLVTDINSVNFRWSLPEHVCVMCSFDSNPATFDKVICDPSCPSFEGFNSRAMFKFVQAHIHVCLRDSGNLSNMCSDMISLPTSQESRQVLHLRRNRGPAI